MATNDSLVPATELAQRNGARYPNESKEYRQARNALLAEEIELRRHIERVAEQRRQLPPGGEVTRDYRFEGENGPVSLAELFGDKETLVIYSYMFGPQRARPCPMCTSLMSSWEEKVADIEQRVAFATMARSPIDRQVAARQARGWTKLKVYADTDGAYTSDYVSAEDADVPAYNVFTRKGGRIRHSGAARWAARRSIQARIRAVRPIWTRSGPFWTPRPRAAEPPGIRSWNMRTTHKRRGMTSRLR